MTSIRRLVLALSVLFTLTLLGALGYYLAYDRERPYSECFFRTVMVMSTVNEPYDLGASSPLEEGRRRFLQAYTSGLLLVGIGVVLYVATTLAGFILETDYGEGARRRRWRKQLALLDRHIIICGGGETGSILLEELQHLGEKFLVIENCPDRVEALRALHKDIVVVHGDATHDSVLLEAGIERARGIIVALPGDMENLFVVISARQLNSLITVTARSQEPGTNSKLRHAGADFVVAANEISAKRMVSAMVRPNVVTFLDHMLRGEEESQRVEEVVIHSGSQLEGKTLRSAEIGARTGLLVIATQRPGEQRFRCNPSPDEPLLAEAALFVLGDPAKVPGLRELAGDAQETSAV